MRKQGIFSLLLLAATGCSKSVSDEGSGYLSILLNVNRSVTVSATKSSDAATFALEITQGGKPVQKIDPIGTMPDPIELTAGDYTLTAYSEPFAIPKFDTPVYGGTAETHISTGCRSEATIRCVQTNAAVRISYTEAFLANHPVRSATVRQIEGALDFSGDDAERTGYFKPGSATLVVTAGEAEHEQPLILEAQKLYLVEIDDAPEPTTGNLNVQISVSTEVTEENVPVVFPSGRVSYCETIGSAAVSGNTQIGKFEGWSCRQAAYSGTNVSVSSQNPSALYAGASAGNNIFFSAEGAYFVVSGLNTATASTSPTLRFGCANADLGYTAEGLTVSVSTDGGGTYTPLGIAADARPANKKWALVTLADGIPKAKQLAIRFEAHAAGYRIDDISLTAGQ